MHRNPVAGSCGDFAPKAQRFPLSVSAIYDFFHAFVSSSGTHHAQTPQGHRWAMPSWFGGLGTQGFGDWGEGLGPRAWSLLFGLYDSGGLSSGLLDFLV